MEFFEERKPAAILKHAIIAQYVPPFAGKTGMYSSGHRVAVIDGYAGEGRYRNGEEASPALLMRKARELTAKGRRLECHFVENDPVKFAKLKHLVDIEGRGLPVRLYLGSIKDHLSHLLTITQNVPLLIFLDPFGLMMPFETVSNIFTRRSTRSPATELLVNFNASGLRRIAGLLTSPVAEETKVKTLSRMDEVCGGDWWRQEWLDHQGDSEAAEAAVVNGYARRLAHRQGCGLWTIPVRNRAHHKPAYYLIFLTRHPEGMSEFGEALSRGLERWRRALYEINFAGSLFGDEASFRASEQSLVEGWVNEIEANLRRLLKESSPFTVFSRYNEVFGTAIGQARETHLRTAWRRLYPDVTKTEPKNKLIRKLIEPA